MRPPRDWHGSRPLHKATPPWWLIAPGAAGLIAALLVLLWPAAGGSTSQPASVERDPCATEACPAPTVPAAPSYGGGEADTTVPQISGKSAVVMEADCGELLYGKELHERLPPASTAKIMTALVAVDEIDLDEKVVVRVNSELLVASTASTVMGLQPGQVLTIRDLLHGLLLSSGNDAGIAIAEAVSGNEPAFVELMNAKAAELGLTNTHFSNPHGLDEPHLYASAYDMAVLGRELLENDELAKIVNTKSYQPSWDGPQVWNGNALLDLYPWSLGIKIGLTENAGQTIVAAAEANGRTLIVSILGSWDRYGETIALFEWAFAETESAC